jgi:hypothetical protein
MSVAVSPERLSQRLVHRDSHLKVVSCPGMSSDGSALVRRGTLDGLNSLLHLALQIS